MGGPAKNNFIEGSSQSYFNQQVHQNIVILSDINQLPRALKMQNKGEASSNLGNIKINKNGGKSKRKDE